MWSHCNQRYRRIRTFCTLGTLRVTAHVEGKKQGDTIKVVGPATSRVNNQSPKRERRQRRCKAPKRLGGDNARQQMGRKLLNSECAQNPMVVWSHSSRGPLCEKILNRSTPTVPTREHCDTTPWGNRKRDPFSEVATESDVIRCKSYSSHRRENSPTGTR